MKISKMTDAEIVEKVKQDKEVYAEIVKRYEDKLLRYVKYLIKDDAEVVVQEVFIKAYINLNSFNKKRGKFSSWIYRIAHNEAINKIKKKKWISLDFNDWLKEILPGKVNIEKEYEIEETKKMVKDCLSDLKLEYKSALSLYYLEDKKYKEISDILKIPIGTVGIRIKRAKEKLKIICSNKDQI